MTRLLISIKPRIHLNLFDLSADGYRRNGGAGFAVKAPLIELNITRSHTEDLSALAKAGFLPGDISSLTSKLQDIRERNHFSNAVSLRSADGIFRHQGLGSGTAITLALVESTFLINHRIPKPSEIVTESGRGGTSGIGLNTYFRGGFIVDMGRAHDHQAPKPSALVSEAPPPLLLRRAAMPPTWTIGLLLPHSLSPPSSEDEYILFEKNTPISLTDAYAAVYHGIFGLLGGVLDRSIETFATAVNNTQTLIWKRAEHQQYSGVIDTISEDLRKAGAIAVGLSSLGPLIYFLCRSKEDAVSVAEKVKSAGQFIITNPANDGRRIIHD